jgi:hypothetical protein
MPALTKAQREKQRRQSRGHEEIIRVQDLQNAAYRLRASQQSQDISINHQQPPPNISSSSSSSPLIIQMIQMRRFNLKQIHL